MDQVLVAYYKLLSQKRIMFSIEKMISVYNKRLKYEEFVLYDLQMIEET